MSKVNDKKERKFAMIDTAMSNLKHLEQRFSEEVISTDILKAILLNIDKAYEVLLENNINVIKYVEDESINRFTYYKMTMATLTRRQAYAHKVRFIKRTSPLTMDPVKIKEHSEIVLLSLKADTINTDPKSDELIDKVDRYLNNPDVIKNVNSYRGAVIESYSQIDKYKSMKNIL